MIYSPGYSKNFECLAGACPDTCCAGWEIIIDEATALYYSGLNTDLGQRIKSSLATDTENNNYFKLHDNRCPFLNGDDLCEIHIHLGEEHTSKVCRQHPWFIEEYEGFTEKTLGLSCPAVSRIVFSSGIAGAYPEVTVSSDDEVLNVLTKERSKLFAAMDENRPADENIDLLFAAAGSAQIKIDELEPVGTMCGFAPPVFEELCSFVGFLFNNCEILTEKWKNLLRVCQVKLPKEGFENYLKINSAVMNRGLAYYVYRYFLKAVNTLDCGAYAKFIVLSVLTPALIAFVTGEGLEESFRLYSKEIEHCPDNLDAVYDFIASI